MPTHDKSSPRVVPPTLSQHSSAPTTYPRVPVTIPSPPPSPHASVLQSHITTSKNKRFHNATDHRYPLRSKSPRSIISPWRCTGANYKDLAARVLSPQQIFQHKASHIFRPNKTKETIDSMLKGPDKELWTRSLRNEWGRLAQRTIHRVWSTDTVDFIHKHEVPQNRTVTYASFVLDHKPLKAEPYRVHVTVGGDKLPFEDETGSPASNLFRN